MACKPFALLCVIGSSPRDVVNRAGGYTSLTVVRRAQHVDGFASTAFIDLIAKAILLLSAQVKHVGAETWGNLWGYWLQNDAIQCQSARGRSLAN